MEVNSPWMHLLSLKYGMEDGGWFPKSPTGSYGVGLWKEISKETTQLKQHYAFELGDGSRVKFWKDAWCDVTPLCLSFPSLFEVTRAKGAKVMELWEGSETEWGWNFRFGRSFNDWELETVQHFICKISPKRINPSVGDRLLWKGTKDGYFTIKSSFDWLEGGRQQMVPVHKSWFFRLGGLVGKVSYFGPAEEKGVLSC